MQLNTVYYSTVNNSLPQEQKTVVQTIYTTEGNIASVLRRLAVKCASSKGRMISILRLAGKESIHS